MRNSQFKKTGEKFANLNSTRVLFLLKKCKRIKYYHFLLIISKKLNTIVGEESPKIQGISVKAIYY